MKTPASYLLTACILLVSCTGHKEEPLLPYVDTRVGTAPSTTHTAGLFGKSTEEYGQTLPAVLEPNGMNFWTAQTQDTELKCKAPYYYKDERIQGFRNSHWIVGGCTQDYGSMTLMPVSGTLKYLPEERGSLFSHQEETATPAYYSVHLKDYSIFAEMTGRSRSAIFRFTYNREEDAYLVVNPNSDEGEGYIVIDTIQKQIRGYNPVHRIYQGWGEPAGYSGYFVIQYQDQIKEYGTFRGDSLFTGRQQIAGGTGIGAYIRFKTNQTEPAHKDNDLYKDADQHKSNNQSKGNNQFKGSNRSTSKTILVKAASSFTDMEGALKNLEAEIPHWDFDRTRQELTDIWEQRLSLITVQTSSRNDKEKFYGALYRASFLPRTFNDADGRYPSFAAGQPVRQSGEGRNYYEDYSMWDTYRALHPLINILTPKKAGDMMQSLVDKYEQGGWLPIFPCWNSYTAAMIGDHCIAALGDAYIKGIRNFDIDKAYEGMIQNAFITPSSYEEYKNGMGRRALDSYLKYGYIPLEDSVPEAFHTCEQVSRTLEYAYDDFVLAQVLLELETLKDYHEVLNRANIYAYLMIRARYYRNVIDPATGYAQGRHADGTFLADAGNAFSFTRFITEGAPCHYTWYVPHNVYGLMECMGGKEKYVAKLDSMFSERRYWHGNEPCHQIAYLFNYAGQPWKTQRAVRHIMETEYLNAPGGLSGNDDAGQMSAWYVFSAMGFYPVCPGTPFYIIGSPSFPRMSIRLENGKTFTVIAKNADEKNIYIQSARLNGEKYDKSYFTHWDIVNGGTLEFEMGAQPNTRWGASALSLPPEISLTPPEGQGKTSPQEKKTKSSKE